MNESPAETKPDRVECPAAMDPAVRLFIVAAMLLGFAAWCYVEKEKYPAPAAWDWSHVNEAGNYVLNNFGPYVFGPVGLVFLAWGVVFLRRRLIADQEGIGYVGQRKVPWDRITKLDAGMLKNKGILSVHCSEQDKLVLDSWKLKNFRDLVAFVESHVKPELLEKPPGEAG
jgi:hypothetical protein